MDVDWPVASVVVLNYNGLRFLDDCFRSLERLEYPRDRLEVIMVDNGSTDGSVAYVQDVYPWVRVIVNKVNLGFAGGNNVGLETARGEYILTLNNDTRVEPTWLVELVRVAESEPRVGMCASKMLFMSQPDTINSTGICLDRVGIAWDRRGGEPDTEDSEQPVEIFGPCAGAALYRRRMLDEIGGFGSCLAGAIGGLALSLRPPRTSLSCLLRN